MLRKASEAVSEGNGPVHQEEYGFGQPAPVDEFREINSLLKEHEKMLKELRDDLKDSMRRLIVQYAARLQHVSPWRQTGKQTLRLASARRAPQQQYKQCVGMAFLHAGLNPAQTPTRPVSA